MKVVAIGIIRTPFKTKGATPIQPLASRATGRVKIHARFAAGLKDIDGFSHVILLYRFHKSKGFSLLVRPFMDSEIRGLFATRYPRRPNQIGMSVVKLVARRGNTLIVSGIDVLDGTPLLDIKPYVPEFGATTKTRIGWLEKRLRKDKGR